LSVPDFAIDAPCNLLIGDGEPATQSNFSSSLIVVWHRRADGTLSEPVGKFLGNDGFLYSEQADVPKGHEGFPRGIAIDSERQILYVLEVNTHRIFRYRIDPDGSLHLQTPWLFTGIVSKRFGRGPDHLLLVKIK